VAAPRALPAPPANGNPDILIREHPVRRPSPLAPNARGYVYAVLPNGAVHVSWSDLFDFVVSSDGRCIDVYAEPDRGTEATYTYLISQVISVALVQLGIESLHASAVAVDNQAIVLIGDSGYGKSTLTAALLRAGAKLITDDLLVLRSADGGYDVTPGAFRLKLDPGTARELGVSWTGAPMADGSDKLVYLLEPALCVTNCTPLGRILLLQPNAREPRLEAVLPAAAMRELLAATFNPLHTEPARLTRLLQDARQMARTTRIERLHVPRDLRTIDQVVALSLS
jgi:energy-coupling factor transporter ATP-binding protein EcfA2